MKKLLSIMTLAIITGLSSCKEDETPNALPKEEATAKLSEFNASATDELRALADASGLKAVTDFFNLVDTDDPFSRVGTDKKKIRDFFRERGKEFKSVFVQQKAINGRTASDEPFDFEEHVGIYSWNPALGEAGAFEKVADAEYIQINFPTEGSVTNNASLRITVYNEVEVNDIDTETIRYEPEDINAAVYVNEQEVASLDLHIGWDPNGFPTDGSIELEVSPFAASLTFDDNASTSSSLSVSLSRGTETLISASVTANYSDDSKSEESLQTVGGFVQVLNIKLEGTVDIEASNAAEVNWDEVIDIALFADNKKIGDLVFVDENEDVVAYIQYADGSREKLDVVLQEMFDEVDALTEDLENNG